LQIFTASRIVPISASPIRDGWVAIDRGRIVSFGEKRGDAPRAFNGATAREKTTETDLGSVAIMPALVNAHAHLELSWMRGAVPTQARFPDWIRSVIALRRNGPTEGGSVQSAISDAIGACHRSGTALVGDVANTMVTVEPLGQSPLHAVIFHELIDFKNANASALVEQAMQRLSVQPTSPNVRLTLAAHAPYSVSPLLFRGIKTALSREPFALSSVHLGESAEELVFLEEGSGPWRSLLEDLGVWDPSWVAPACDPAEYLDRLGFLDDRLVCVHGVHLHDSALQRLARRGSMLVTCPRGNRLTGAGSPPIGAFYAAGLRVAVGTDSLASVPDLNLFSELAELRRLAPDIPARLLLESATSQGARALGWDTDFGPIEAGRRATLIAVKVPENCADVEEYLVSGVQPEQVSWVT
jgi:cytosine/adenosine deaminase-related metal-dependent hydrolase